MSEREWNVGDKYPLPPIESESGIPLTVFTIDCAHYSEDMRDDGMGFLAARCACGWLCPPCPDEETRTDALMQHAYEAGILAERAARGSHD